MTNKGKHSSQTPGTFYRDLAIMILGIVLVGAAVFFLLYLFADEPTTGPTTTTTTIGTSSTAAEVTSTTGDGSTTTTLATTSTSDGPDVRPPSEVTVIVLNSIGVDGAAGQVTADLAEAGYQTLTPDNFEPEQDPSRIWYREGYAAEAAAMIDFLPGADVESIPDDSIGEGADVVMVLGTGFEE
ncbi:MAG: LytR C-terminal domain-containing protein [Acidimicrobiia bacterium]